MLNSGDSEEIQNFIRKCVEMLGKRFDAVQVFASKHDNKTGKTFHAAAGLGNWYARYGQVTEWVNTNEQAAYEKATRDREDQNEDEDEDDDEDGHSFDWN